MMRTARWFMLLASLVAAIAPSAAYGYVQFGAGYSSFPNLQGGDCYTCHGDRVNDSHGPHGGYSSTSDQCDTCHWTMHDTYGANLLFQSTATMTCRTCHDGTGAYGVYQMTSLGLTPGAAHRIEGAFAIPGGDGTTGGSRTATMSGTGGQLGCEDCHSVHGSNTVEPYRTNLGKDAGGASVYYASDHLLRRQPTGAESPVDKYGSDWCLSCHNGRSSGGVVHNHPVDSVATTPSNFTFSDVLVDSADVPIPLALSEDQAYLYVADVGNHRVQQFTTGGAYVAQWASQPNGRIAALGLGKDMGGSAQRDLFVHDTADADAAQVRYLTQSLGYVGAAYEESGPFTCIAADRTSTEAYGVNQAAVLFQMWTTYKTSKFGTGIGIAESMAVSATEDVYIADSAWNRIAVFDTVAPGWPLLRAWPAGTTPLGASSADGQFDRPLGVALSPDDNRVYVADSGNDRIQYFTAGGALLGSWGTRGSGDGQFIGPSGVIVAADDSVWVADSGNHRIQHFSATGTYLGQVGTRGMGPGQLALTLGTHTSLVEQDNGAYLMRDPRLVQQDGHGPVCQQCHADSRDVGDLVDGLPAPTVAYPEPAPGAPPYQAFPHETSLPKLLVEQGDDLCLNCHMP